MNKAIVIGTYHGREAWLKDCLESLNNYVRYPILSLNVPWELNAIRWIYDETFIDEFLFLQDTVIVKNHKWIDEVFDHKGSVSLCHKPFFMYLGKYERRLLTHLDRAYATSWPLVTNKREAVTHEGEWTGWYNEADPKTNKYLWDLDDTEVYEFRHGRNNKVIENDHIIKYKGTWSPEMIENAQ